MPTQYNGIIKIREVTNSIATAIRNGVLAFATFSVFKVKPSYKQDERFKYHEHGVGLLLLVLLVSQLFHSGEHSLSADLTVQF